MNDRRNCSASRSLAAVVCGVALGWALGYAHMQKITEQAAEAFREQCRSDGGVAIDDERDGLLVTRCERFE